VPESLEPLVAGYDWERNAVGEGGGAVYHLHRPGRDVLYLKVGQGAVAPDIADEMGRLRWLRGRVPVPEVVHFVASGESAWLLMTALPGRTAWHCLHDRASDRAAIVDTLAAALLEWHRMPIGECPFDGEYRVRLAEARARLAAGRVDPADFTDERAGWSVERAWEELVGFLPIDTDPVVTHGDFTLDNVVLDGGRLAGSVDVGRAGVADRYQDLALLWAGLGEFGDALQRRFLASYGVPTPDMHKLRFHLALDEWF